MTTPSISTFIDHVCRAELTAGAKLVGIMLRRLQGANDRTWPSVKELGDRVGLGKRAVLEALAQLRAAGFVDVRERRGRDLARIPSEYACTLPPVRDAAPPPMHDAAPGSVHEGALPDARERTEAPCTETSTPVQIPALHLSKQIKEEDQERERAPAPADPLLDEFPGSAARVAYERAVEAANGIAVDAAGDHAELAKAEEAAERVIRMRYPRIAAHEIRARRDELLNEWAPIYVKDRSAGARAKGKTVRLKAKWFAEAALEAAAAGGRMPAPHLEANPAAPSIGAFPVSTSDEELERFS